MKKRFSGPQIAAKLRQADVLRERINGPGPERINNGKLMKLLVVIDELRASNKMNCRTERSAP